jgi:hypothetical protein
MSSALERTDPAVHAAIQRETERQQQNLELIASENVVSEAVLEAQGSILTNKYAEGYPGKRYYGGCQFVDEIETLAIERARALFGSEAANVQPHSGLAGEHVRLLLAAGGRRHDPRHEPVARRPPDARESRQLLREVLQGRAVRRARVRRSDRFRSGARARAPRAAEDDRRRALGLSARHRLRAVPGDRRRRRCDGLRRHGALRGARRRGAPSVARAALRVRDDHHAQDAPRPAWRADPLPAGVREVDQLVRVSPATRVDR